MLLSTPMSTADYDQIYVAPHPDDAALSCGGTIACRQLLGAKQLVVTLCTAAPPAAESVWRQRLEEEENALRTLGVDFFFAGFLDAPYRHPAYHKTNGLFMPPLPDDPLPDKVFQLLSTLGRHNKRALLYAPLGIGQHVDHIVACDAARSVQGFAGVYLYEDFPYTLKYPGALETRLQSFDEHLIEVATDIRGGFRKKAEAVAHYASQVHFLFGGFDAAVRALYEEAQRIVPGGAGERCWKLTAPHRIVSPVAPTA